MNLPDLIKRSDRAVRVTSGSVVPGLQNWHGEMRRTVTLEGGTELLLLRSDEFECLRDFPHDIAWRVWHEDRSGNVESSSAKQNGDMDIPFVLEAVNAKYPDRISVLFNDRLAAGTAKPVSMDWTAWTQCADGFHLRLRNRDSSPVVVDTGPHFESRSKILPLIHGNGIEIGPGLNPHILPSKDVEVRYVESASAEEWVRNYKKADKPSITEQRNLWSNYVVADAQMLSTIADGSLDFIYSNHVFEHLMNPLGVLENWRRKLRPSGKVLGVVPDCRYIFDLRQPPSSVDEWLRQHSESVWTIGSEQYERWCRFTAPYNTPEDLIARKYSIHVHFYTSETFPTLCRIAVEQGLFKELKMETSPNNRDFGFVLKTT